MTTYAVEGIILKHRDSGENDRLITLLAKEKGKLTAIARGLRKPQSKLKGYLELFRYNFFQLAVGKNFDIITNAETLVTFDELASDPRRLALASYFAEATDRLVGEREPVPQIFNLLLGVLELLKNNFQDLSLLRSYFLLRLATLLGFQPELYQSILSGERLTAKEKLFFSAHRGGLLTASEAQKEPSAFAVSPKTVKALRLLTESDPELILKLKMDAKTRNELKRVAQETSLLFLEEPFKSEKFLS